MARDPGSLERLARELAALTPEERAKVLRQAALGSGERSLPAGFKPPQLGTGGTWVGGSLHREELYDDHGR